MMTVKQLIEAPASDSSTAYETLGYVDAYDAVLNADYAFVAYKETNRVTGDWCVRIRSSQTVGAVFEPEMIRNQARAAFAQGRPWFKWGHSLDPSPGDARDIQLRVHVADGRRPKSRFSSSRGSSMDPRTSRSPFASRGRTDLA
jgi:hypothetical protein